MIATIVISLLVLAAVVLAVRSIVRSRKSGGCDACGDSAPCSACPPNSSPVLDERPKRQGGASNL